jgi:hypothetical protein
MVVAENAVAAAPSPASSSPHRSEEKRRQQLLCRAVPELGVLDSRPATPGGANEPGRDALGALPGLAGGKRRPAGRRKAGAAGRVVDPHVPAVECAARRERLSQEIRLDRGRDNRALPFQDRGHGEAGRLAGLHRTDHDHRLALFGGD